MKSKKDFEELKVVFSLKRKPNDRSVTAKDKRKNLSI